jgi:rRNA maturation endonuclease Nob1
MNFVAKAILKVEDHSALSTDVYILQNLHLNLKSRLEDGFYAFKVNQTLK